MIAHPWEECRGIGHSFGYNRAETVDDYATSARLVALLVDTVSRGGNLLLDIGPTADGRIPVIMQERLVQLGEWLGTNGEAIYGTRRWRVPSEGESVRYTTKDGIVYAIHLGAPGRSLTLATPRPGSATRVRLLGTDSPVRWKKSGSGLRLDLPESTPGGREAYVFELQGVR